ncbi:MAG: tryptophan synthase subunit alpha [Coriobacteriia bacterium]|nr:tryptophan synthase subunit alpha [Coriobacteriia bacterium]
MQDESNRDGAQRLGRAFSKGHPALVTYLMAGYPTRETSLASLHALADAGSDLIELGVPFADPLADGPVIRNAADKARQANEGGFGLAETIALAADFLKEAGPDAPPVALMTYLNPLMRMGLPKVADALRAAGVGGVIVPDMPPEMAGPWLRAAHDLDTVFLAAPTSTPARLEKVALYSSGFVYCVSSLGVTGERSELPEELTALVSRVRDATVLPVAVGFGISTPEHVAAVARIADGIVVGSALVKRQDDPSEVFSFASELVKARDIS